MPKMAKILVVDDEPAVLEVIQRILVDRGFWVDVASNGLEALGLLEQNSYDLMLSDVKMPHMDGMELLQKVGLLYPDLITVMLSAFANIQDAVAAIKLGAYDYIAKPVYPEDLVFSIERALKFKDLRQAAQELEWTLKGAEALGLQVLDLAPEAEEFQNLEKLQIQAKDIEDLAAVAKLFLQGAQKLTLASRGSVFLFDHEGIHLSCLAMSENQIDRINEKTVRPGEGVMSSVLQSRRPLLVSDVALEPRFFNHQRSKRYDTKSFIVVPIIGEKIWGVINLADRCDLKAFSPRELFLIWLLARILATKLLRRRSAVSAVRNVGTPCGSSSSTSGSWQRARRPRRPPRPWQFRLQPREAQADPVRLRQVLAVASARRQRVHRGRQRTQPTRPTSIPPDSITARTTCS